MILLNLSCLALQILYYQIIHYKLISLFFTNFFCCNSLALFLGTGFSFFRSVDTLPLSAFRYFTIIAWWLGELKSITAFLICSKIESSPRLYSWELAFLSSAA